MSKRKGQSVEERDRKTDRQRVREREKERECMYIFVCVCVCVFMSACLSVSFIRMHAFMHVCTKKKCIPTQARAHTALAHILQNRALDAFILAPGSQVWSCDIFLSAEGEDGVLVRNHDGHQ